MVAKPLCPLYKNIIKPLDRARYPELRYKLKKQTTAKSVLSLSPSLVQVRQDCIINLDYLISIENYTLRCIFSPPFDQENITVSRRCYKAVKEKLEIL